MKKRIVLIVSIVLVFLAAIAVGAVMLFDTSREPMAKIMLADYDHHDAETSDGNCLVQAGARLYYSVDSWNNPVNYGIYEISNRGIKRVWWDGIKSPSESARFNNLAVYDDSLALVDPETGQISLFDSDKGEFVQEDGLFSRYVVARAEYQKLQTENDSPALYANLFGRNYYVVDRDASPVLFLDVTNGEEDKVIFEFSQLEGDVSCRDMYSRDATVFIEFVDDSGVCCLEYYPEERKTVIVSSDEYKGRYFSPDYSVKVNNSALNEEADPDAGIFVTDNKTKETKKIYDKNVHEYHILDDKWVYFTLEDYSLWRISIDGETLEQVF